MQLQLRPDLRALPQKLMIGGVWLLALAFTAWIVAGWYWHLSGTPIQSARPSPVSDPVAAAQDIASRQLFGNPPAEAAAAAAPPPNFIVLGLSTRWGKLPGYAIIKDGAAPANSFVEGEEIAAGVKLVRVLADAIEIDRNGVREQIRLNASSQTFTDSPQPRPSTDAPQIRTTPPSGVVSAPAAEN